MKIGYARVSTGEQHLDLQLDALHEAGVEEENIYTDQISGAKASRPNLDRMLEFVREGDTIVVWRLDRFGRSLKDLMEKVEMLEKRGIQLISLHENIDTTSAIGKLTFHIFGALAEFERNLIRERTMAGLRSARARGKKGGRRFEITRSQVHQIATLVKSGSVPIAEICATFGISRSTLYRYVSPTGELRPSFESLPEESKTKDVRIT